LTKVFGGRYEVIEKIGAGGMAVVYKARDTLLNRVVTVKVLRDQFASDQDFVRRFRREAQSAAGLSHPNIVSIYDVGKDEDTEYIVMEYIEGHNLKEIIRNYAPLSAEQAINLVMQIGEAIRHAHQHEIIHRDIKPQNILVTPDGRVKVTDFGIARAASSATLTHTGDIVGSVHYLSPEQARGVQTNAQSDIYSLGIILYELVTGRVPYDGETPITIALKHLQETPTSPSKLNPHVSPDLENVIMKAIAKSPEKRYQTMDEFLADLRNVRAGRRVVYPDLYEDQGLEVTQVHKNLADEVEKTLIEPQDQNERRIKLPFHVDKNRIKKAAMILGVLILLFGGFWWGIKAFLAVESTTVPNLENYTIAEAKVLLDQYKLKLDDEILHEYSDTVEKDKIIRQYPPPFSRVKVGREVQVVISDGVEMLEVPNVKGKTEEDAVNAIRNAGFTGDIEIIRQINSAVPKGEVIDQNPLPNALWYKNSKFTIVVSEGPELKTIEMPMVVGYSAAEAQLILTDHLLIPKIQVEPSNAFPRNVVIRTVPEPGDLVKQGSEVTLIVSEGPGPLP